MDLNWKDVDENITKMVEYINEIDADLLVGVARGGLVPAVILSHRTNTPLDCITWQTRDNINREVKEEIIEMIDAGKTVVFVDDLTDSGNCFLEIDDAYNKKQLENVQYVTIISKDSSNFEVDFAPIHTDTNNWVVFPWEEVV